MQIKYRTISLCALVLFLARATVPVGYMVSEAGVPNSLSFELNLCPSQNNFKPQASNDTRMKQSSLGQHQMSAMQTKPHSHDNRHSDVLKSYENCQLWVGSANAIPIATNQIGLFGRTSTTKIITHESLFLAKNASQAKYARAPPSKVLI